MADISTLQQTLINAKKVMNKVSDSNFTSNNTNVSHEQRQNINMESVQQHIPNTPSPQPLPNIPDVTTSDRRDLAPKSFMTEDRINKSKLPDIIKEAMIKNPIPDVPFGGGSGGLDDGFLQNVRTEMDKQGITTSRPNTTTPIPPTITEQRSTPNTKKISSGNLKSIIKEAVKELLDETITAKLNESIGPRTDAGENFQFTVGNKVFYGKITSSNTIK